MDIAAALKVMVAASTEVITDQADLTAMADFTIEAALKVITKVLNFTAAVSKDKIQVLKSPAPDHQQLSPYQLQGR